MKTNLYSLDGKVVKQIDLPKVFETEYRDDLIKRAVLSDESRTFQPKGNYKYAGMETSAKYRGRKEMYGAIKNKGIAHLPHEVQPKGNFGKVKRVPQAVKGRRAHPPKPETKLVEEMNHKEYLKALGVAIGSSTNKNLVKFRCSVDFESLPIVLDNSFEKLKKTKEVVSVFDALKCTKWMNGTKEKKSVSALIVVSGGSILKAAANISGVDVVSVPKLTVKHFAPGTKAGRLVLYTESALKQVEDRIEDKPVAKPAKKVKA
ncbi:MAG: 50S ribosomal protein L4 [Candidatus Micrarchaeota archaeon]